MGNRVKPGCSPAHLRRCGARAYLGRSGDHFKLKATDLGNGHLEIVGSRTMLWEELDWPIGQIADHLDMLERHAEEHAEEIRQKHAEQAAKRAKKRVRQLCKGMGADTLLTLTYQANETDMARCKADLKEFNRRMLRLIPGFRFVAAFERQDRGACHVHMATERIPVELLAKNGTKVKSFNVIRAVWRGVTKERGGNIDVQNAKRRMQRTPARIASYIAGYIIKAFEEGELESNRWTKYGNFDAPPKPVDLGIFPTLETMIAGGYAILFDGHQVDVMRLDRWKDWFVLYAELPPKRRAMAEV
ncbi:hypothetical protein RD110_10305 [Rhodoferax koreense]|uniref:Replication-associated protein ORF2/G2P domain-containing protein n=1 Tax=Rhodoferax koreensis TaxID=1842727 RepID=A0A1P8JV10_9BURK|nr:hypothetical protein RD110_10305 [Rhodoferax koreense]